MFCEKCGSEIKQWANFCKNCGNTLIEHSEKNIVNTTDNKPPCKKFNFWKTFISVVAILTLVFSIFFGIIGSFEQDAIGAFWGILILATLIGLLITIIIKWFKGEKQANAIHLNDNEITNVRKSLKNTGDSIYAVGWLSIIINSGIYLWMMLDKNYSETGLPAVGFLGLCMVIILSSIFIILGKRIGGLVDKKIELYLQILLVLSILYSEMIVIFGGRIGLLFFILTAYLISSLNLVGKAMKSEEFISTLINPKYKLDKKGWIIFALASVAVIFIAGVFDLSRNDTFTVDTQKTNAVSYNTVSTELNDFVFSNWQVVTSSDGSFSVKLPKGWQENIESNPDPGVDTLGYSGSIDDGKTTYMVQRADYTKTFKKNKIVSIDEETSKKGLQVFMDGVVENSKDNKVTNSQFVDFKGHKALRFSISNSVENTILKGLALINDKTVYILVGQSNTDLPDLENFINSFSLNK